MRRGRLSIFAAAVALISSACAAILGIDEPAPVGLDGGGADVVDGGSDVDSGFDASPFCSNHRGVAFCADFEEDSNVANGFDNGVSRGRVSRETDDVASGLAAALSTLNNASPCSYADLLKTTKGTLAHAEWKVRLGYEDANVPQMDTVFAVSAGDDTDGGCGYLFQMNGVSAQLHVQGDGKNNFNSFHDFAVAPKGGEWTLIEADFASVDGGVGIVVKVGGRLALSLDSSSATELGSCGLDGNIAFSGGLRCVSGSDEVRIDDMLLELKP